MKYKSVLSIVGYLGMAKQWLRARYQVKRRNAVSDVTQIARFPP